RAGKALEQNRRADIENVFEIAVIRGDVGGAGERRSCSAERSALVNAFNAARNRFCSRDPAPSRAAQQPKRRGQDSKNHRVPPNLAAFCTLDVLGYTE
ncbi:MAG: hypothetical protein PVI23_16505, partial [Maricaulaceae bacterium]